MITSATFCEKAAQRMKKQMGWELLHQGKASLNRLRVVIAWGKRAGTYMFVEVC